jgi:hypothetical protein
MTSQNGSIDGKDLALVSEGLARPAVPNAPAKPGLLPYRHVRARR